MARAHSRDSGRAPPSVHRASGCGNRATAGGERGARADLRFARWVRNEGHALLVLGSATGERAASGARADLRGERIARDPRFCARDSEMGRGPSRREARRGLRVARGARGGRTEGRTGSGERGPSGARAEWRGRGAVHSRASRFCSRGARTELRMRAALRYRADGGAAGEVRGAGCVGTETKMRGAGARCAGTEASGTRAAGRYVADRYF
ncbi:hypothetical protein B0H15DRAFT_479388 [Mycena belliarum]|uniref:Uncharacterized protein n=1 Tax=Mycena belliarum TaxID=1033014 RepID=A0AAD6TV49_9AGAR|nr:hypothetical protein B0H15DRAFT_479388 [Mycena belliae]